MKRGKTWMTVDIYDENDDCILYEVYVEWEYDPNGGNEARQYWFDYTVLQYPEDISDIHKYMIDQRLKELDIEEFTTSEYD